MSAARPVPSRPTPVAVVPEVVAVRVPGRDFDILLAGEPWRCRVLRLEPPLFCLTPAHPGQDCAEGR